MVTLTTIYLTFKLLQYVLHRITHKTSNVDVSCKHFADVVRSNVVNAVSVQSKCLHFVVVLEPIIKTSACRQNSMYNIVSNQIVSSNGI